MENSLTKNKFFMLTNKLSTGGNRFGSGILDFCYCCISFHPRLNWCYYVFALGCTVKSVFVQTNGWLCILVSKVCQQFKCLPTLVFPSLYPELTWRQHSDGQTPKNNIFFSGKNADHCSKSRYRSSSWKQIIKANDTGLRQCSSCSLPGGWEKKYTLLEVWIMSAQPEWKLHAST